MLSKSSKFRKRAEISASTQKPLQAALCRPGAAATPQRSCCSDLGAIRPALSPSRSKNGVQPARRRCGVPKNSCTAGARNFVPIFGRTRCRASHWVCDDCVARYQRAADAVEAATRLGPLQGFGRIFSIPGHFRPRQQRPPRRRRRPLRPVRRRSAHEKGKVRRTGRQELLE